MRTAPAFLLTVFALSVCALSARAQEKSETMISRTFTTASGGLLEIEVADADLEIETGASEARVEVVMTAYRMSTDRARAYFEDQRLSVGQDGRTVYVRSDPRKNRDHWGGWRDGGVSIRVLVAIPETFDVRLFTSDGDIILETLAGRVEARTSDGDVRVRSLTGPLITLRTSDGDVRADRLEAPRVEVHTSDGDIDLGDIVADELRVVTSDGDVNTGRIDGDTHIRTSDGDLRLGTIHGPRIDLRTSDGRVAADELVADDIEVHTADGDITLARVDGALRVTAGGDIHVGLVRATEVRLRSTDGDITIDLPDALRANLRLTGERVRLTSAFRFEGDLGEEQAEGRINGGGPLIEARAHDGTVALRRE